MQIKYIKRTPTADEFNMLTEAVDWGIRPNEDLGAGMILYNK